MKKLNKKGFTLIELLVVVAIIAILAGIVLVSLNSARERSRKSSLQSTLASVMPVAAMCVNDGYHVATPSNASTGGGYICTPNADGSQPAAGSETDIDETWPGLNHITGTPAYQYSVSDDTTISASDGAADIVTCSVTTTSCALN